MHHPLCRRFEKYSSGYGAAPHVCRFDPPMRNFIVVCLMSLSLSLSLTHTLSGCLSLSLSLILLANLALSSVPLLLIIRDEEALGRQDAKHQQPTLFRSKLKNHSFALADVDNSPCVSTNNMPPGHSSSWAFANAPHQVSLPQPR